VPLDPWSNPYTYRLLPANNEFEVVSWGRDGKPGGEGDAADLSSAR
jgi:general secretion pathway protein G